MPVANQLKNAIETSGQSRYAIAKGAGIKYSTLVRFLDENADIRLSTVDALAGHLGIDMAGVKRKRKAQQRQEQAPHQRARLQQELKRTHRALKHLETRVATLMEEIRREATG